jgi:hypothetical protein
MKNLYYFLEKSIHINLKLQIMLLFISFSAVTIAQQHLHDHMDRCHTDETYSEMILANPEYAKNKKIIEREIQAILNNPNRQKDLNGIITIPVVYHVIHNGDAVGTNENLSTALLQAQLDQLTADFRRTNSDAGNTPADFTGVAADSEIEFCLTTIDETGAATSGITRHHINTFPGVNQNDCWTSAYINTNMKPSTIWDRDKYLNIWTVVKINRTSDCADTVLGYAQFPGGPSTTDGAVLRASTVGSIAMPNPGGGSFAIGRTGTHEVGHYLNLSHIWGSNGCTIGDNVSDTPSASGPNYIGSPCTYPGPNSCNDGIGDLPDMFQNYMDYSDDACFNLFTTGQKNRMHAAITASRPTLITAPCGATPANDLQTNAISIDCITATYTGTTITATSSDAPDLGSTCGTSISAPGVWYKMDGMHADVTLDLCQAPYDSKMNIYEDDGTGGLICIDGEDDDNNNCAGNFNDPYITFASEIGKTYYIYIQGFSGATGTFTMNVSCDCYNNVVNSNDSGPGSLRDVVACASDGDVITFDPSTNGQNIMLSSGQIVIDKSLTIQGNGMDNTIIDGALDDVNRIFNIPSGGAHTILIEGLTIQNGGSNTSTSNGAAIQNHHDLELLNVKFKGNSTTNFNKSVMMMWTGNATIINCIFEGNINNSPTSNSAVIYAQASTSLKIHQSLFIDNVDLTLVYSFTFSDGLLELINNTTYNNTVNPVFQKQAGTVHIDNNIISETGDALDLIGTIEPSSTITNNLSGAADPQLLAADGNIVGDPLFVDAAGGDFNLQDNSPAISAGNNAQRPVDILDVDGDADITEFIPTDIEGNTRIAGCGANVDLGAYENDATSPGLVVTNSNDSGGGSLRHVIACAADGDNITFDPSTNGQNIMLTSGQIVIDKSLTIQGNGMDNTIIDGALDIGNDSRVFRVLTSNTLSLHDITIQNAGNPNLVSLFGGAIFSDGDVKLVNSRFDNNKAFLGGAIRMQNGNLSMINCEFSDNLVDRFGGAINTRGTNHYAYNCLFYNNTSNDSGGALYNETGTWHIYNSTFTQNTATTGSAGGIRNLGTIDSLVNCIVYNNSATISSFNDMSTSAINAGLNNLIGIYTGSSLTDGVNGNISGDPLFVNATTDDFNLALNSPCFNTGNNAELPMDIFDIDGDSDTSEPLPTDISGIQARSISGTVDMGAYERIPDVCEDTYPILCGETLTEDITGYLVNFGCGAFTFQSKIHEFTATTSGTVTIDLSNFVATKYLYLYDDNICGTTCNILSFSEAGGAMEQIVYPVTSGTTYYIEVYDFSGSGGTYQLSVTCETPCDTDLVFTSPADNISTGMETFSTDENITSDINISGTSTEVIYSAGNTTLKSITLNAGFEVELGAEFEANMDGCLTAPLKPGNGKNTIKRTDQSKRKSRK